MNLPGPSRRTYYDMNPWYTKNRSNGINDWHQHVLKADSIFLDKLLHSIAKNFPKNVIELGCGAGDFTLSYSQSNFTHIALEFSSVAIEMAKEKNNPTGIKFKEGDALARETLPNEVFDMVVAKDVLHCILKKDRKTFLDNLATLLNPNGILHLTTHVGLPIENEDVMKYVDSKTRENHIKTRLYLDIGEIEKEFSESNLLIIEKLDLPGNLVYFCLRKS